MNAVRYQFILIHGLQHLIQPTDLCLGAADASIWIKHYGIIQLNLNLGGSFKGTWPTTFFVVDTLCAEIIIGTQVIFEHSLVVDLASFKLYSKITHEETRLIKGKPDLWASITQLIGPKLSILTIENPPATKATEEATTNEDSSEGTKTPQQEMSVHEEKEDLRKFDKEKQASHEALGNPVEDNDFLEESKLEDNYSLEELRIEENDFLEEKKFESEQLGDEAADQTFHCIGNISQPVESVEDASWTTKWNDSATNHPPSALVENHVLWSVTRIYSNIRVI